MNIQKHLFSFALTAFALMGSTNASWAQCEPTCPGEIIAHHTAGKIAPATVDLSYQTVQFDGKCWLATNLGTDVAATAATDATDAAAGWYWQFNRKQGYSITGGTTTNGSGTRAPLTTWIAAIDETADWQAENDPCTLLLGASWRIPTKAEYDSALVLGNGTTEAPLPWANYNDTYASPLKLHAAGYLSNTAGALSFRGAYGYYWSSTQSSTTYGYRLNFNSSSANVISSSKAYGFSLRCCRDF
jgi:uncharacterized protein (TIGR02145 family)